jgi:serine/threonine protein kinase
MHGLTEDLQKSIQMEISLLQKLDHKNIVKYIDAFYDDSNFCLILEYVDGGPISNIIKTYGPYPESLAAIYTK